MSTGYLTKNVKIAIAKKDRGLFFLIRRVRQLLDAFSKDFSSPEKAMARVIRRYNSTNEVNYYQHLSRVGFFHEEKEAIKAASLKQNSKVLVIGCGTGRECFAFEELGHRVVGLDYSQEMIESASAIAREENSRVTFVHGDISSLGDNESEQKFDLIFLSFAISNHIQGSNRRVDFLNSLNSFLKSDGKILVSYFFRYAPLGFEHSLMSFILKNRWGSMYEDGDMLLSHIGFHNSDSKLFYYHLFLLKMM